MHFGSKEELLFALSRSGHESALRLLRTAIAEAPTPGRQLEAVMARFSEWHAEQHQVARVVQYEHHHLTAEHHAEVLALRKEMDSLVRDVLERGVADGSFAVDVRAGTADTALALLSIVVDVARWYSPTIRRTPGEIGATNAALALRLVGASRPRVTAAFGGHSVLQVPVPPLEAFVLARTRHYDTDYVSADPAFVHAHVTALAPFLHGDDLTTGVLDAVGEIAAATPPFDFASNASTPSPTASCTCCPSRPRPSSR